MLRISITVSMIVLSLGSAFACGDKLLMLGRGVTFAQINRTHHSASILIYLNQNSQLGAAENDLQLLTVLRLVGHRPKSVANQPELLRALSSERYDFVVADFSDAGIVKTEVEAAPGSPLLLPLLHKPSKAQLIDAQKQFACAFKADRNQLLRVLDEMMKSKQKEPAPLCRPR